MSLAGQVKKSSKELELTRAALVLEMRRRNLRPNRRVTLASILAISFLCGVAAQRTKGFFLLAVQRHIGSISSNMASLRRQVQTAQSALKMFV